MTCKVEAETWACQQPWRATGTPFQSKIASALCSWMAETWDCQQSGKPTGTPLTSRVTSLLFTWLAEITAGTDDEGSTDGGDSVRSLPTFPRTRRGKSAGQSSSQCRAPPGLSASRRMPPGPNAGKPYVASKRLPGGGEKNGQESASQRDVFHTSTWSIASGLDPYLMGHHFAPPSVMPLAPPSVLPLVPCLLYPPQAFGWPWAYSYGAGFTAGVNAALPIDNTACVGGPGQLVEQSQAGVPDGGDKARRSPHIRKPLQTGEQKEQLIEFERSIGIVRDRPSKNVPSDKKLDKASRATTMMLRNIPNKITQQMMVEELDSRGFKNRYDFLYVPIDFRCRCNMGYAFMNFLSTEFAELFLTTFSGLKLGAPVRGSKKTCVVCPARIQGLSANVAAYRNSPVMGCPVEAYKPIIIKNGEVQPFPDPEGDIAPVILRKSNV